MHRGLLVQTHPAAPARRAQRKPRKHPVLRQTEHLAARRVKAANASLLEPPVARRRARSRRFCSSQTPTTYSALIRSPENVQENLSVRKMENAKKGALARLGLLNSLLKLSFNLPLFSLRLYQ